ncbi:glycosyltransferase [Halomonas sp. Bachu 37]|uniref:O-linked N-acetylglucosamine transferase family protein n=1 Tax=Halomonas kashgarensis TaxID=3084920 RepID=UPI0032174EF6
MAKKKTRSKAKKTQQAKRITTNWPPADKSHDKLYDNLGVHPEQAKRFLTLLDNEKFTQAQALAQQLTREYPENAFAWKALGTSYLQAGDVQEAHSPLHKAVALDDRDPLSLTSLAAVYYQQGNNEQAIQYQSKAVALDPSYAQGRFRLAEMLHSAGQQELAIPHVEAAIDGGFEPFSSKLLLGVLLYNAKYFNQALSVYHLLEKEFPPHPSVYNNLGNLYKDIGQYKKAESYYQQALELDPGFVMAYSNIFFSKHYNPDATQEEIHAFAKQWDKKFALPRMPAPTNVNDETKPLRVGLISSGFRLHPVGQMISAALQHSRSDIHFYGYSTRDQTDFITQKVRDACKVWRPIRHLSQYEVAQQLRDDKLDILIDLSGHGDGNCLQAISMRPAPLCVKWVGGLVNTMGVESIDYLISDHIETPEGVDDQYTEKLIRLPDDYICYMPPPYSPATNSLPALKNRYITLGCLNNPAKISAELLEQWARLMHELPESRLLLRGAQYESEDFCRWIWEEMSQHGIEQYRVLLEGPIRHKDFIATYQRIDIALDTWPYSGGLTTCEAMLMGVPVVTLPGPTFAGRHSATHLINAGLNELVTTSWEEYRQRVLELASDLPNLAVIRAGLRTILHYSPVCDAPRFANHFNNALRAIWLRYCEGKSPEALTFNKEGELWFEDNKEPLELPEARSEEIEEGEESESFEWQLDEPVTIIDNAAVLPRHLDYPNWMASGHLAVISFDPASLLNKKVDELKAFGELHHYPHAVLGDGQPATLYAALEAEKGSTLKPLPEEEQPEYLRDKVKTLAELPISTVRLDDIEGIPNVDVLVLDDLHDAMKVLENGEQTLKNTLLIQVKVAFQPTHERQPNLAELQHWASQKGFKFLRLENLKYMDVELLAADAIFIKKGGDKNKINWMLSNFYHKKNDKEGYRSDVRHKNISEVNVKSTTGELDALAGNGVQTKKHHYESKNDIIPFLSYDENGEKNKILFVCSRGETFIKPIVESLESKFSVEYWHLDYRLPDMERLQKLMDWSDVTWFEWCDEVIAKASYKINKNCKVVCRLHGFEAFTPWPKNIKANFLDQLIFVSDHMMEYVKERGVKTSSTVIHNGVDIESLQYKERSAGFDLAFVAALRDVKNPQLLVQIIEKLVSIDRRYTLHVAGKGSDLIIQRYMKHILEGLDIKDNVIFYGHVEDIDSWLENKNYLISTSVSESFGYNIAEAMAKGIKPIIHNWPGAKELYPSSLVFNTVDEAVSMFTNEIYNSGMYRDFVLAKYSRLQQIENISTYIFNVE